MANYANLGQPLKRGNSDIIVSAVYSGTIFAGRAVALDDTATQNTTMEYIAPISASNLLFTGFVVGGDTNVKAQSTSIIKSGLSICAEFASGQSFSIGDKLSLNNSGLLVARGDASAVIDMNAVVKQTSIIGYRIVQDTQEAEEVSNCLLLDLYNVESA